MSKVKQAGKTRQHANRPGKRLGVKKFGGQSIKTGQIILRQKGTKVHPGPGVGEGRDRTLFALTPGAVTFYTRQGKSLVSVTPAQN